MKKLFFFLFLAFFFPDLCFSQTDSCSLRISLLTCAPGEELYASFGHTALRVQDSVNKTDLVFNYGTFEFSPDFEMKFIKGKLLYSLSVESFPDFLYAYQVESRSVQEQVLQLNCSEKMRLRQALVVNAQEQNRYYRYDFLFDNCTTRAGDMVIKNADSPVVFENILPDNRPSFRDLIHSYLDAGHQYWSKLGIDILLGVKVDRKASNHEAMFLPDYLLKGFDHAHIGQHSLASKPTTILEKPSPLQDASTFTPTLVFILLLVLGILLSVVRRPRVRAFLGIFDFLFFLVLGLSGLLILFMWFGTDHKVCQNNFNLAWALPTNVVAAFFVRNKKSWVKYYFLIVYIESILLLAAWFFIPQQMNGALLPVVLLIIFRSAMLSKLRFYAGKRNHPQ
ncbi:MAG: DUF4105 domain-containing protein [Flavisolibacter sp.]